MLSKELTDMSITIDLGKFTNADDFHRWFKNEFDLKTYGKNWDALWDALTGMVVLPSKIKFLNFDKFESSAKVDAETLKDIFNEYAEYEHGKVTVEYK